MRSLAHVGLTSVYCISDFFNIEPVISYVDTRKAICKSIQRAVLYIDQSSGVWSQRSSVLRGEEWNWTSQIQAISRNDLGLDVLHLKHSEASIHAPAQAVRHHCMLQHRHIGANIFVPWYWVSVIRTAYQPRSASHTAVPPLGTRLSSPLLSLEQQSTNST
jgi:hypothetical protein